MKMTLEIQWAPTHVIFKKKPYTGEDSVGRKGWFQYDTRNMFILLLCNPNILFPKQTLYYTGLKMGMKKLMIFITMHEYLGHARALQYVH